MHWAVYLYTASDCRKTAVKLHKQFTHPTSEKVIKLLRNANINSEDVERGIKAVSEKCDKYMFSTAEVEKSVEKWFIFYSYC